MSRLPLPTDAPDPAALARLAAALAPGSRIRSVTGLPGGLDAAMHSFVLQTRQRSRRLVLRRYVRRTDLGNPAANARRAWRTLQVLARVGLPAPRPVWLDPATDASGPGVSGTYVLDCPALVMTRLAGRTDLHSTNEAWTGGLAAMLLRLHRAPLAEVDLSFLPGPGDTAKRILRDAQSKPALLQHPDASAVLSAVRRLLPSLQPEPPVLVHGDYWAGNTVSRGRRVAAIVDWDSAAIDQPGLDVGYCRMDLAMLGPDGAPAAFTHAYERESGHHVANLPFWDLLAALRALPDPERWLPGYHGLGRTDITGRDMQAGLRAFIAGALRRAG